MAVLLNLTIAGQADAAARSEVGADGRKVVVEGGTAHSIASTNDGHVIDVDGLKIRVEPDRITVGGDTRTLPDYKELRITVEGGRAMITVDGEPL